MSFRAYTLILGQFLGRYFGRFLDQIELPPTQESDEEEGDGDEDDDDSEAEAGEITGSGKAISGHGAYELKDGAGSKDSKSLSPLDIDAHWLQRKLSRYIDDANVSQQIFFIYR